MNSCPPPIRILIVDDDEDDFLIIRDYIKSVSERQFIIDWCYKYEEALEHICNIKYDIYFVDYLLGEKTGLDLLREAKHNNCEEPFILLTGIGNREVDLKAMLGGAVDYIEKSELNTEKLERCIRYSLERSAYIKAIKANERKFHGIFEKSKDPIFLADENLIFKEFNSATLELFEYSKEELLQLSLYSLFVNEKARSASEEQLQKTGEITKEVELLTKMNEKKTCILSVSKETDSDGNVYVQGVIRDITSLKQIEKATLQIEKLQASDKLLRTLAHEVRNPLSSITLSLEQLKPEITTHQGIIFADIIDRNSRRIESLISELLRSASPIKVFPERVTLQSVIDNTLASATDRISLKRVDLKRVYPDQDVYIMADAEKLKIAFLNIIINAIEAVQLDKGQLTISIISEASCNKVLISDNGSGISDENLPRIFDPYFTSKPNGFGLGLATVFNIIQSNKASIDVRSQVGNGTTFILTFGKA